VKRKYYLKPARKNNFYLALTLLPFLVFGCGREKIPQDTLVKVYVENTIVQEKYLLNQDSLRFHKQLVYDKYNVSEKDFISELGKYSDDKIMWENFFKKANAYLNELSKNGKLK
jgi:hypothetical protein